MSRHLQKDIENLTNKITHMSGVIEDRLYQATQSVVNRDAAMAQAVINGDNEVDLMEVDIEEECCEIAAKRVDAALDEIGT